MTTARNFSRKFAEHPLELSPEIASRYFPMSSGLANFAQRKSLSTQKGVCQCKDRRQSRKRMDIEEKKLVNMNYLSD
jgi:hypothetical protein